MPTPIFPERRAQFTVDGLAIDMAEGFAEIRHLLFNCKQIIESHPDTLPPPVTRANGEEEEVSTEDSLSVHPFTTI